MCLMQLTVKHLAKRASFNYAKFATPGVLSREWMKETKDFTTGSPLRYI
jgi:hypothetical protein